MDMGGLFDWNKKILFKLFYFLNGR
jgi:hypothetical protein